MRPRRGCLCTVLLATALFAQAGRAGTGRSVSFRPQHEGFQEVTKRVWERVQPADQGDGVRFKLFLRECNLEEAEELALQISSPNSLRARQFLSKEAISKLVRCPSRDVDIAHIKDWVKSAGHGAAEVRELSSYLEVITSVQAASVLFGHEAPSFHKYRQLAGHRELIRASKPLSLPEKLRDSVDLILGLHELPSKRRYRAIPVIPGQRRAAQTAGAGGDESVGTDPQLADVHTSETIVNPRLIQHLYAAPSELSHEAVARQGLVEFDDFYRERDVCQSANLLGGPRSWLKPPDVTYYTDTVYNASGSDTSEATLDVEIMGNVGAGVPIDVVNLSSEEWILDWAALVLDDFSPEDGGPLVWSISYGFPEIAHGYLTGQSAASYIRRTNTALMKLALLGVTVLVSSGDDGAPGFSFTCPSDPSRPVLGQTCPIKEGCGCSDFVLHKVVKGHDRYCIYPLGSYYGEIYPQGTPGTDCGLLLEEPDCLDAMTLFLEASNNTTINGCKYAVSSGGLPFTDCQCSETKTVVEEGSCRIKGYVYDESLFGTTSMFAPDFPASSPWVTAVGSTQVAADPLKGCRQTQILSGDPHTREMATARFNGGGGFSLFFGQPPYQKAHVQRYLANHDHLPPRGSFDPTKRAYPDISALGWYHLVIEQGQPRYVGGTSASAPTVAGLVALLNEELLRAGRPALGFLNPFLYHIASQSPNAFNKVRPRRMPVATFIGDDAAEVAGVESSPLAGLSYDGSNNLTAAYNCRHGFRGSHEGWDPVTGLGTPNYMVWRSFLLRDMELATERRQQLLGIGASSMGMLLGAALLALGCLIGFAITYAKKAVAARSKAVRMQAAARTVRNAVTGAGDGPETEADADVCGQGGTDGVEADGTRHDDRISSSEQVVSKPAF